MNLKIYLKNMIPTVLVNPLKKIYYRILYKKYLLVGRKKVKAETSRAKARREREGFFEKYCIGNGLDIGYGGDKIIQNVDVWDIEHGDAQYLESIKDMSYDFVYSSHTIEHMLNPGVAIQNWFRAVKNSGYLIIYLPHRDLYEKKLTLPSRFNADHKFFFVIDDDELPDTIGIKSLLKRSLVGYEIEYVRECNEGYISNGEDRHSAGEYSIEVVIKKK